DLVGTDPVGDLALLKVRDAKDLVYVEFGDISKVRVGQQVLAVGDPFKLAEMDGPPSVSLGTVSALHRFQGNYSDAIQTDGAVNPGNSGGPLLTLDGKLIGITGQIMSRFGAKANTGIGYAIPVDQIQRFFPLLKEAEGKIVYHGTLPDGMTFTSRADDTQVASVENIQPDSEADKAGFRKGDRIIAVDGKRVYNYARLTGIVRSYPEKSLLDFRVERAGQTVTLKVKLPRHEINMGSTFIAPVGVRLEQLKGNEGAKVLSVERNSAAEKAGLQQGDVITTVEGRGPSLEWYDILASKKPGETLELRVRRAGPNGNTLKALTLTVPDPPKK
ncbi:MAG TPA: PDZ domain-containing protein, partial [Planctomycetota bacterium]|nr:PDZ domain-containing protein [Planctomycetota bacterium]